jgi:hypothetical protein
VIQPHRADASFTDNLNSIITDFEKLSLDEAGKKDLLDCYVGNNLFYMGKHFTYHPMCKRFSSPQFKTVKYLYVYISNYEILIDFEMLNGNCFTMHYFDYKQFTIVCKDLLVGVTNQGFTRSPSLSNQKEINMPILYSAKNKSLSIVYSDDFAENQWQKNDKTKIMFIDAIDIQHLTILEPEIERHMRWLMVHMPLFVLINIALCLILKKQFKTMTIHKDCAERYINKQLFSRQQPFYDEIKCMVEYLYRKKIIFSRLCNKITRQRLYGDDIYCFTNLIPHCLTAFRQDMYNLYYFSQNLYINCSNSTCWKPLCPGGVNCIPDYSTKYCISLQ